MAGEFGHVVVTRQSEHAQRLQAHAKRAERLVLDSARAGGALVGAIVQGAACMRFANVADRVVALCSQSREVVCDGSHCRGARCAWSCVEPWRVCALWA